MKRNEETKSVAISLIITDALMYFLDKVIFFSDKEDATKLTTPVDIPKSDRDTKITIRFVAAEKTPFSETDKYLATISVYKKPRNADSAFPKKRVSVSLNVEDLNGLMIFCV